MKMVCLVHTIIRYYIFGVASFKLPIKYNFISVSKVEEALVQRKKMELLQKYVSDSLQAEEEGVKEILGVD